MNSAVSIRTEILRIPLAGGVDLSQDPYRDTFLLSLFYPGSTCGKYVQLHRHNPFPKYIGFGYVFGLRILLRMFSPAVFEFHCGEIIG